MKRVIAVLLTCLLSLGLVLTAPMAAEAKKKKRDTPGCVTAAEYRAARAGMSGTQVRGIFDTYGSQRYYNDHGYWEGEFVDEGYYDSQWVDTGSYVDELGNYVEVGYYENVWQPNLVYNAYDHWVPMVDTVRTYKKCKSFNRGRGRVAINYDNYSRSYLSGVRLAYKHPSNPAFMDIAASFRTGARHVEGKEVPAPTTRADAVKPAPKPTVRSEKPLGKVVQPAG